MPRRKRRKSEEQLLRELRERADLIRRRSAELIRETAKIAGEVAARTARVQDQSGPVARTPW
jgi:hypothetical protein